MGEMTEAPAPVDQSPPIESGGGSTEATETLATDCYNDRAAMDATEMPAAEQSGNEVASAGEADGENGGMTSSEAWEEPDDGEASSMESLRDLSGGETTGVEEGNAVPSSEQAMDSSELPSDSEPERGESQALDGAEGASKSLPKEDPLMAHWNPKTEKWDPETEKKIKKLGRKRMSSSNYMLPTDYNKYFEIPTGEGPKQPLESELDKADRRFAEMKAWRKKVEEQSPLVYNRKVGKRSKK